MAAYPPPIENLPIFDPSQFIANQTTTSSSGGGSGGGGSYVNYPIAQGALTIPSMTVTGACVLGSTQGAGPVYNYPQIGFSPTTYPPTLSNQLVTKAYVDAGGGSSLLAGANNWTGAYNAYTTSTPLYFGATNNTAGVLSYSGTTLQLQSANAAGTLNLYAGGINGILINGTQTSVSNLFNANAAANVATALGVGTTLSINSVQGNASSSIKIGDTAAGTGGLTTITQDTKQLKVINSSTTGGDIILQSAANAPAGIIFQSASTAATTINPSFLLQSASPTSTRIRFLNNMTVGTYNSSVQSGDNAIVFQSASGPSQNVAMVLCDHNTGTTGLRLSYSTTTSAFLAAVSGNLSVSGTTALTGVATAPTAVAGTNTTQVATTAFVTSAIAGIAPTPNLLGLNNTWTGTNAFNAGVTLNSTVTYSATSAPTFNVAPTFNGGAVFSGAGAVSFATTPTTVSPAFGSKSTQVATTAFVSGWQTVTVAGNISIPSEGMYLFFMVAKGGNQGTASASGAVYGGGGGGGGSAVSFEIYLTPQNTVTFAKSDTLGGTYTLAINGTIGYTCYVGNNGNNAGVGVGGTGGVASTASTITGGFPSGQLCTGTAGGAGGLGVPPSPLGVNRLFSYFGTETGILYGTGGTSTQTINSQLGIPGSIGAVFFKAI